LLKEGKGISKRHGKEFQMRSFSIIIDLYYQPM